MTGEGIGASLARIDRGAAGAFAAGTGAAAVAVYLLLHGSLAVALAFCMLPFAVWLFGRPEVGVVLLGASIPVLYDLTGGRGGFHLAFSDLLLVLVGANVLAAALLTDRSGTLHALRPLKAAVAQYGVLLVVLLIIHFSLKDLAQTGQRFELFLVPLVVGAFAAIVDRELAVLKAYVVAATALAALWPVMPSLGQKNPVGQMIGNALLVLFGVRRLRPYAPLALVLVPGLLLTGSRGAVVATVVGLVVILALQDSPGRVMFTRLAAVGAVAFVAYSFLPVSLQSRLTTFAPGTGSRAAYALHIRQQYLSDAEHLIAAHPIVGVGVGNYLTGATRGVNAATDPHNVLLLQAAEGGYLFALSFLVLIFVAFRVLRRLQWVEIAPVAAGVFLATFAHGLVDVYWVRGTPMLAWLLLGMACAGVVRANVHSGQSEALF
jgi:hypothetical protein